MGFATRQIGNMAKPNLVISVDDAGVISMKSQSSFKTSEIKFKLNEEFDETTADDRKTKVSYISIKINVFMSLSVKVYLFSDTLHS